MFQPSQVYPRNWGTVGGGPSPPVLDTIAPGGQAIIAAANVIRTATGLFLVSCSYSVIPTATDDVVLSVTQAAGTTAWSGGTPSVDGTWLYDVNGPIVATSSGQGSIPAAQNLPAAASQPVLMTVTTLVDFSAGVGVGSKNLIIIGILHNGSAGLVGAVLGKTFFYELP